VLVDERGQFLDHVHVLCDRVAHAGPLHFDDDRPAVAHHRAVDLAEGGGRQRLTVERLEGLGDAHAELVGDDLLDLGERKGLDVVLQTRQGLEIDGRQQVGSGREQLAELDECRAHRLEVVDELLGVLTGGFVLVAQALGPAVLDEQASNVAVARQMTGLQREGHAPLYPGQTDVSRSGVTRDRNGRTPRCTGSR
jgi:hypothetical protein